MRKIARTAMYALDEIPSRFLDDGCTFSPDSILRTHIRWCCRIHDYRYCTRANDKGDMTRKRWISSNRELYRNIGLKTVWYTRWVRKLYYFAVKKWGWKSYDSCGPDVGEMCRHNMPIPLWMEHLENTA